MERDKRIELSPPPWQGGVLPLYESRVRCDEWSPEAFIARRLGSDKSSAEARSGSHGPNSPSVAVRANLVAKLAARLIDFHDASCLHDGRFFLAFGKTLGALAIDVDATELFAVVVIHGDLPMAMLASAVAAKPAGTFAFCLGSLFFHDGMALNAPDYRNFNSAAQVARRRLTFLLSKKQKTWALFALTGTSPCFDLLIRRF
jgi:hypothetical protein